MSEYIISDKQLKTATEAYLEHELSLPITGAFISGDKLPEIVRCRDCRHYDETEVHTWEFERRKMPTCGRFASFLHGTRPDGYCAWGERRGA